MFKFEEEVHERRDILITSSVDVMSAVLQPEKLEMTTWWENLVVFTSLNPERSLFRFRSSLKEINRKKMEIIGGIPKDDDPEIVREIRRRLVGMIQEAADCGFL